VAGAGIVNRDPFGVRKTGAQHIAGLIDKPILAGDQQADNMALGDHDAKCLQQCQQPRHRHLRLMILSKHEAAQFRAKMPADAGWQRRCHCTPFGVCHRSRRNFTTCGVIIKSCTT